MATLEEVVFSYAVASTTDANGQSNTLYLTKESNGYQLWCITKFHLIQVDWYPTHERNQAFIDAVHLAEGPYEEIAKRFHPRRYLAPIPREDDD